MVKRISKLIFGDDVKEPTIPNGKIIQFENTNARPVVDVDTVEEIELDFGQEPYQAPLEPQRVRSVANTFLIYVEKGMSRKEIWEALEKKSYEAHEISAGYNIFRRSI